MTEAKHPAYRWRELLLALALASGISVLLGIATQTIIPWTGDFGYLTGPTARPFIVWFEGVTPNGPAAKVGIRVGDRMDKRDFSFDDRVSDEFGLNRSIRLHVRRDGTSFMATVVPITMRTLSWDQWLAYIAALWLALFAGIFAWKRPDNPSVRLVAVLLSASALSVGVYVASPLPVVSLISALLGSTLDKLAMLLLSAVALQFGKPPSRARRVLNIAAWICGLALAVQIDALRVGQATAWFDINAYYRAWWFPVPYVMTYLLVLAGGMAAIRAARGTERALASWIVIPTLVTFAPQVFMPVLFEFSGLVATAYAVAVAGNAISFLWPLALAYAVLSRRLVDMGFVLNRAAVFGGISLVVVGVFVLVEYLSGEWLRTADHRVGTIVTVAVALAVGLSLRFIHRRVEHVVDSVFFHKRHENEVALRRFAREAPYISDRDTLLDETVTTIKQHSDAAEVSLFVRKDGEPSYRLARGASGSASNVSENDRAVVAMRIQHDRVDLHDYVTNLAGEFAFPMVSRGQLVGILVCGEKVDGESYAPDESEAFSMVAHGVGAALAALDTPQDARNQILALQSAIDELRAVVLEFRSSQAGDT